MVTTQKEIVDFMEEFDVKFIRLAFFDLFGNQKNISIMPHELEGVFEHGQSFDASAIRGFRDITNSDLFLFPELSTLTILPWRPQIGRVVRMYCEIRYPDGRLFELDTRSMLKQNMRTLSEGGYQFMLGTECEFYLFERDEKGNPTDIPYDQAGYCDVAPLDKGENIRREICLNLEEMGILPESSHHEQGPGQNEVDFRFEEVLSSCDNLMTFRNVVDVVALINGLYASFEPKPIKNEPGNGMHINLSVFKDSCNVFAKDQNLMNACIAGIMRRIKEITLFLNPDKDSYARLGENKAPKYISYSHSNRSALIRIPAADEFHTRLELRSADPSCNPYIAFMLVIAAGMEGVEEGLHVEENSDNVYLHHDQLQQLPNSLEEAIAAAENSTFVKRVLPERLITSFLADRKEKISS